MLSKKAASAVAKAGKVHHRALSVCSVKMCAIVDLPPISKEIRKTLPAYRPEEIPQTLKDEIFPKLGNRDIVGPGYSVTFDYMDVKDHPLPSVRWAANTPEVLALREKEGGDWKTLTLQEKKQLYRNSFRQTFAEVNAPDGQWKRITYYVFYTLAVSLIMFMYNLDAYGTRPKNYNQEFQEQLVAAYLMRNVGPNQGLASKYDFENNRWKE